MVLLYIDVGVFVNWPLCCVFFVCMVLNQITCKKLCHVLELSTIDALLHKIHNKVLLVLKLQGFTCVDP